MNIEKKVTTVIILKLNEQEALWLKALVQNPLGDKEEEKDSKMRQHFFHSIPLSLDPRE